MRWIVFIRRSSREKKDIQTRWVSFRCCLFCYIRKLFSASFRFVLRSPASRLPVWRGVGWYYAYVTQPVCVTFESIRKGNRQPPSPGMTGLATALRTLYVIFLNSASDNYVKPRKLIDNSTTHPVDPCNTYREVVDNVRPTCRIYFLDKHPAYIGQPYGSISRINLLIYLSSSRRIRQPYELVRSYMARDASNERYNTNRRL